MEELFIIDVDPGLDDARAMVYAFNDTRHKILAVTSCSGNVDADISAFNVGLVATACNRPDIVIYKGKIDNLRGNLVPPDGYYGVNGLGNLEMFEQKMTINNDTFAPSVIVDLINSHPHEINMIMCGPCTNLARAWLIDRSLSYKVKKVYLLGGDRTIETSFNHSNHSEFNANRDPEAYNIVLRNFGQPGQPPVIVFDWTSCIQYCTKSAFLDRIALRLEDNKARKLEANILRARSAKAETSLEEEDDIFLGDELVVAAAFNPELITMFHRVKLDKIECRQHEDHHIKRGKTFFIYHEDSNIFLVDKLDIEKFKEIFTNTILQSRYRNGFH